MKPTIAITIGDPAGIGPEITAKALADPETYRLCNPVVVGDSHAMQMGIEVAGKNLKINIIEKPMQAKFSHGTIDLIDLNNIDPTKIKMGEPAAMTGAASAQYVIHAADLALNGAVDAIVTAPLNKEALHMGGYHYPGHTELLAEKSGTSNYAMMLATGNLRVVHATTHIPFREIVNHLTTERIYTTILIAQDACLSLGIENPRIAVAGLNPHSGDGGLFGDEEERIITPAIEKARKEGLDVEGPVPPDTVFGKAAGGQYDIVVALYHDQGHIPVKLLGMKFDEAAGEWTSIRGVNITLGLKFIRTSVDHGTAYGKAGRKEGTANPDSLKEAIQYAVQMAEAQKKQ
ncbi:MAG: 4-hydroxythreonine-4-phosphate dehydrogenase PdxA [Candidatus Bathyarchaeota archaeon]|nr:4-hydroxythreonine-4-phosphate dehydrogenase PdxA [Candidatus Bathyarchaeota archaeon]